MHQHLLFVLASLIGMSAVAQAPDPRVKWEASLQPHTGKGGNATLDLSAEVAAGWHVYALTQRPGGPTALKVTLENGGNARFTGAPVGTAPEKRHDPSFDLDTEFYSHSFALHFPIRVQPTPGATELSVPVSIRFQTCSDRECQPPRTVHISASTAAAVADGSPHHAT
jgi:Disulphide bond corrector protein DsbC